MTDETYRRFDSGRFGIVQADPGIFQTKIEGALSVPAKTPGIKKKKKKEKEDQSIDLDNTDTVEEGEDSSGEGEL